MLIYNRTQQAYIDGVPLWYTIIMYIVYYHGIYIYMYMICFYTARIHCIHGE